MTLHDVTQRSEAWKQLRAGKVTSTRAKAMLTKIQKGEAAARRDLKWAMIAERLTGKPQDGGYVSADMQWGIEHEEAARRAYEAVTGRLVQPVGFCEHDTLLAGTSPDGFVGLDGAVSIKAPKTATHIGYLREQREPADYEGQNSHELFITGRAWIDFVSFDPRLPLGGQLVVIRITRARAQLELYERELRTFLAEVETEERTIRTLMDPARVLAAAVEAVTI